MDLKTFLGAINKDVISQMAISKSIWGNLNSLMEGPLFFMFLDWSSPLLPLEEAWHAHT